MNLLRQLEANLAPGPFFEPAGQDRITPEELPVRLVAFYLPQFHPIPENDAWWGRGFTEWTNVTRALPRFFGHYQPRLPADLGFYDLRLPEILREQAKLARRHGIYGFCFHHYWFGGRRLLERPLDILLAEPDIDLPFCLSWANESWSRTWTGSSTDILIEQRHSPEDDVAFIDSLKPAFRDPRYIRVNDRPILLVYRPSLLPAPRASMKRWRDRLIAAGLGDPFLVMVQSYEQKDPQPYGFDAAVEFPPHKLGFDLPLSRKPLFLIDPDFRGEVRDYAAMVRRAVEAENPGYTLFRGVCPSWDNEARRPQRGVVFVDSTPKRFGWWLVQACRRAMRENPIGQRFVFINAWNEWAEGTYLEPDRHFGHAYLRETARVLQALDLREAELDEQTTFAALFGADADWSWRAPRGFFRKAAAKAFNKWLRTVARWLSLRARS
jgi:lipopolysaccharide biosynthesis protein